MIPIPGTYCDGKLESLSFTIVPECQRETARRPYITRGDGVGAFMSWWKPTWQERVRLFFGAPVRVQVGYCSHGPLHLDTESDWGVSSPRDW
jgi:hypothetical protein